MKKVRVEVVSLCVGLKAASWCSSSVLGSDFRVKCMTASEPASAREKQKDTATLRYESFMMAASVEKLVLKGTGVTSLYSCETR